MKFFNKNKKLKIKNYFIKNREKLPYIEYDFTNLSNKNKDNQVNDCTINNLMYTSGNITTYSGWTERGLQCNTDTTFDMPFKQCKSFEFQVNTINWASRNNAIVFEIIDDLGNKYIFKGLHWGNI